MTMGPDAVDAFLREPRDGVLSVVTESGRAIGTPVWFLWVDGVARFQSPTDTVKTAALRRMKRASLCVHDHALPHTTFVTLEGPVVEVEFDVARDIGLAAAHYLGEGAESFMAGIDQAVAAGRRWASFELSPTTVLSKAQQLS